MSHKPQSWNLCAVYLHIYIYIHKYTWASSKLHPSVLVHASLQIFFKALVLRCHHLSRGKSTFDGERMIKQVFWTCGKQITPNCERNCNKNILETRCHYTRTLFMLCTTSGGTHTQKLVACLTPHEIPRCCFILHGDFFSGVNGLGIPPVTRKHAGIV